MSGESVSFSQKRQEANELLEKTWQMLEEASVQPPEEGEELRVGVDLGTSSILTIVLGQDGHPLAGRMEYAQAVRDGVVVDFVRARQIVSRQKEELEACLGRELTHAAAAIPPGVSGGNIRAVRHVLEGAGYRCTAVADESTAAARVLGITDGAVVDVGGGTTGITVLQEGRALNCADEPTGGHHITLVLCGSLGISYEEAERIKREEARQEELYPLIRPVVEKMASITARCIEGYPVKEVYVVGGACAFRQFADSFSEILGLPIHKPVCPWLVTPLGIAMYDGAAEEA